MKNLYKKIGEIFIYKKNVFILLTVIFLLIFFVSFSIIKMFKKLNHCQNKLTYLEHIALNSLEYRKQIKNFIEKHSNFDKSFIDNNLENMKFLENEKNILCNLTNHVAFLNNKQIKKRLDFIQSKKNMLKFAEEKLKQNALIKETDETQLYPIEIDESDLQKILSIIEFCELSNSITKIDSPQLIIKNFLLNKEKEKTFFLDMKILKREYLKK